jgi:hypothetical protein
LRYYPSCTTTIMESCAASLTLRSIQANITYILKRDLRKYLCCRVGLHRACISSYRFTSRTARSIPVTTVCQSGEGSQRRAIISGQEERFGIVVNQTSSSTTSNGVVNRLPIHYHRPNHRSIAPNSALPAFQYTHLLPNFVPP